MDPTLFKLEGPAPVAVVTGANSGIGKAEAKTLAAMGGRGSGAGRDPERSAAAEAEIRAATGVEIKLP